MTRRELLAAPAFAQPLDNARTVVLTFDDAVKSHATIVAPLLKKLGFGATFFISHKWMDDPAHFLTWAEVAEIHKAGFEIGNHSWTHAGFSTPKVAARLEAELALIEYELKKVNVPKPVSFAYSGNGFCPEARDRLEALGFIYARRGMQPEFPYGKINAGPPYDALKHDRLLIPTTGDAYPDWTFEHFERVVSQAAPGKIVVLQFHGVPDVVHPWVHTPPESFERYMRHLKDKGYRVIALRDLAPVAKFVAGDPMRKVRYPEPKGALPLPLSEAKPLPMVTGREGRVAPYPGVRHPRIGFLEGAINPMRGTKAMAFLPWDPKSYVVIDVPEAIFAGKQLRFLAHTHIPAYWDERNVIIEDRDWERTAAGGLRSRWVLPDKLEIGATVEPASDGSIVMELSLRNGTPEALRELRSQVCVMFKFARGFTEQSNGNKTFEKSRAIARAGKRAVITEWENCGRTWGNALCPCMHSDPLPPDCAPGAEVKVRGRLWFEG